MTESPEQEISAALGTPVLLVHALLHQHRAAVRRVTGGLMSRRTLSGKQIDQRLTKHKQTRNAYEQITVT